MSNSGSRDKPESIVLATGLTPAWDRAFDRALQRARMWQAHLSVMHVVVTEEREVIGVSRRTANASSEIDRLRGPSRDKSDLQLSYHLSFGKAAGAVLSKARELQCDFLITGLACAKSFGEKLIGSTAERLVREAMAPVLSVRRRAYQPYRSIAVAVDVSEPARYALDRALALFPDARVTAVHAYNIGFTGKAASDSSIAKYEENKQSDILAMVKSAVNASLAKSGATHPAIQTHFSHGDPEDVMRTFVEFQEPDLVVIGTHGRTGLPRALLGSVAARLLATLPCDVLAIHPNA